MINENIIYTTALTSGATLTLAYGILSIFTMGPDNILYKGYNIAQRIFGVTLLLWSAHIIAHALLNVRYTNDYLAIIISLSSYFMLVSGFELVLHSLLDNNYYSKKRVHRVIAECSTFSSILAIDYFFLPDNITDFSIILLSIPLFIKISFAAYRSHKRYKDVKLNIDNYYSDDTSTSVEWMRNSIYIMVSLGFASVIIPYGTALSDTITMAIAMGTITYVVISLRNYYLSISTIQEKIEETPIQTETKEHRTTTFSDVKAQILKRNLEEWTTTTNFLKAGITIDDVAEDINSNRRYISEYLNCYLNLTFKSWIALLKIEHSKILLIEHPEYSSNTIAEMIGYSRSNYNRTFTKIVGSSPSSWRKENMIQQNFAK